MEHDDEVRVDEVRVVSASREIGADAEVMWELLVEPAEHSKVDGNDNVVAAEPGQRVVAVGDVFVTSLTNGSIRHNHVVEFDDGRLLAWCPSEPDREPPGHRWRWELEPLGPGRTLVTHTYDWTELSDETRLERARATTAERLDASIDRLAAIAERSPG